MKLRIGYIWVCIATGLYIFSNFVLSLPDGKLHIIACDVGQGDSTYIKFPDGKDMLIDGGPNDRVIACLGRHMPFWDRTIDLVLLTHPENDHAGGLVPVIERFHIGYFIHSPLQSSKEKQNALGILAKKKHIPEKILLAGEIVRVGTVRLRVVWPTREQIAMMESPPNSSVLGVTTEHLNHGSMVFWLRYGSFDALFAGDADTNVSSHYVGSPLADNEVELLKVPHHGSKTGMDADFLAWLKPRIAIISVGKNTYGHPAPEILDALSLVTQKVLRTDKNGDIEIVSDGNNLTLP